VTGDGEGVVTTRTEGVELGKSEVDGVVKEVCLKGD